MIEADEISGIRDYKHRLTNVSKEFDIGLFLYILRKSIPWVIICLVIAIATAFVYLRYTPLIFQARTIIQLAEDDHVNKILNVESYYEEGDVDVKLEQLRSKLLISRTLQQLPLKVSYFAEGQILTSEHYTFSPYKVDLLELINPSVQDLPISIRFDSADRFSIEYLGNTYPGLQTEQEVTTADFSIVVHMEDWEQARKNQDEYRLYFRINNPQTLTNRFYENIEVRVLNTTAKTLEISYRDNNPYISRDFVRAHANEFITFDLEKRRRSDENVLHFLDAQIDTVFERLRDSEVRLNSYKQQNKITNLDDVGEVYLQRLSNYEGQIVELEIELQLLDEVEKLTRKKSTEVEVYNLIPLVAGSSYEGTLKSLLDKLYNLLSDRQNALYSVTPESERIRNIDYQIDIQKNIILQSITALRDQLDEKKSEMLGKLRETEGTYYNIPQKELEYARLQRLFSINEKYYTLLLEKAIEYRISKEGFVSNNQILEEARLPQSPISPRRKTVWATIFLAGLFVGFMIIAVRYFMHNNITSLNEVVKLADASIATLGVVPKYKENIPISMLLVDSMPRSLIAEAFRSIRTNLQFIKPLDTPRMLAVTSTISGEGKTFVSLNLAGIIAFSGKRVIVCDLDMRKPKIHKSFSVPNAEGMSTLLVGRSTLDGVIRKSKQENLDYITAGPIPPNPSELIIGERMQEVINQLKERYDVVIMDTPPVGLVTDGVAILQKADYPIFVFRADYSRKQFVQVADKLINENRIQLSAILNGVDLDRNRYAYRYSYGYGYGYGYGSGDGYYDENESGKKSRKRWNRLIKRSK